MDPTPRGREATALEQAVSRAMRDNLALVQHTAKELSQAIEDFVAACSSTRNANMLPAMLRAQTAAASLASMLDVLSRLLTASLQPARAGASETYVATLAMPEAPAAAPEAPQPSVPTPTAPPHAVPRAHIEPPPVVPPAPPMPVAPPPPPPPAAPVARTGTVLIPAEPEAPPAAPHIFEHGIPVEEPVAPPVPAPVAAAGAPALVESAVEVAPEPAPVAVEEPVAPAPEPVIAAAPAPAPAPPAFRVEDLPADQQELHRRANRHAKVSMQDIYLLRPKDVQLGRQNRDICTRLKGDIEKARKEYVRRFGPILEHPVDYFHHWMVEVLAEGKPEALGEYPYPSAVPRQ